MKRKHLSLAIVAIASLLAAVGLWLARTDRRSDDSALHESGMGAGVEVPQGQPSSGQMLNPTNSGQMHRPPDPTRKFREMTPEQRVQQARKGHGPGG